MYRHSQPSLRTLFRYLLASRNAVYAVTVPLVMTAAICYAQKPYEPPSNWANTYSLGEDQDAFSLAETQDSGFLLAGFTTPLDVTHQDFWIIKLRADGAIQWQKAYGGNGHDYAMATKLTQDGGYIVSGATEPYDLSTGSRDFWILKLDEGGTIEWENAYGGTALDGPAFAILQTGDGGYITGGHTRSFDAEADVLVLKLDPLGHIEWQNRYGSDGRERRVEKIHQTGDGGYILTVSSMSFTPEWSAWVLKLDTDGVIEWQKVYRNADVEDIQPTEDGGYVVLAEKLVRPADQDFWAFKLTEDGDIEWQKAFGGEENDDAQSIRQTREGGYVIGGTTESFGAGGQDVWVIKLDPDGNIEWEKTYGGTGNDSINTLERVSDGGYVAAGSTESFGVAGKDLFVLKMNEDGNIGCCLPGFHTAASNAIVTDTEVVAFDTSTTAAATDALLRPTHATVTDTSATRTKLCFYNVIPPGDTIECLTYAPWYRAFAVWWIGLFLAGAAVLIFLIYPVARKRARDRQSP